MGRELRRVPMDFDWPLGQVWGGYIMPDEIRLSPCPDCIDPLSGHPDGYTVEARAIANTFYPHQIGGPYAELLAWHDKLGQAEVDNLIAHQRCGVLVQPGPDGKPFEWTFPPRSAEEINAANRRTTGQGFLSGDNHDGINRSIAIRFRCEILDIQTYCGTCDGECQTGTPEQVAAYESWEWTEPPTGDGYQLWETTSEGSPKTPVFATLEEVCDYAAAHVSTFGSDMATAEEWRQMLDEDFVRSEYRSADGRRVVFL